VQTEQRNSLRLLQWMMAASLALPVALFVLASTVSWISTHDTADQQIERLREELLIAEAGEGEQRGFGPAVGEPAAATGRIAQCVGKRFAGRALGGADGGHREPRVSLECGQHLLSGKPGGSQDADAQR